MQRYRATCFGDHIVGDSNRIEFRSPDQTSHIGSSETWLIMPCPSFSDDAHALNKPDPMKCSGALQSDGTSGVSCIYVALRSASEWAKSEVA
jgi:hypothetical protein